MLGLELRALSLSYRPSLPEVFKKSLFLPIRHHDGLLKKTNIWENSSFILLLSVVWNLSILRTYT